jgi:hypothetical protein
MASISNISNQLPNFQSLSSATPFAVKTQQVQAKAQTSNALDLSFLTAEGDRVSLSTRSETNASFSTYNLQGFAEGQAVDFRGQESRSSIRSDFSLLVEGDLNEQELADIASFLQTSQNILQDFLSGNVEQAAETALSLGDLDALSSASLFFRQETTVSLESRLTQFAGQGRSPANELGEAGIPAESGQAGLLDELFAQIRQAQENFQIEPDALSQRIPTFLTQLIDTLGKPFSQDNTALSSFDEIRKEFLQSLLETAKNLTTEDESPQELTAEATDQNLGSPVPPSTEENGEVLPDLLNESEEI